MVTEVKSSEIYIFMCILGKGIYMNGKFNNQTWKLSTIIKITYITGELFFIRRKSNKGYYLTSQHFKLFLVQNNMKKKLDFIEIQQTHQTFSYWWTIMLYGN